MKRILYIGLTLIFLLVITSPRVFSQKWDSTHWEMDIVVKHPKGYMDTVTIGADVNGDVGFQQGLDIEDTTFRKPVAIRVNDTVIETTSNTCPANMRKDIRGFKKSLKFTFFIKSDTFPYSWRFGKDSMIQMFFDTNHFRYENKKWEMGWIQIESFGGYMGDIDLERHCLYTNFEKKYYCTFPWNPHNENPFSYSLTHEQNPNEYHYYFGKCADNSDILKFIVEVSFIDKSVGLPKAEKLAKEKIKFNNNSFSINSSNTNSKWLWYAILNLQGQEILSGKVSPGEEKKFHNDILPPGIYILNIKRGNLLKSYKFFIN